MSNDSRPIDVSNAIAFHTVFRFVADPEGPAWKAETLCFFDMSGHSLRTRLMLALSLVLTPITLVLMGRSMRVRIKSKQK